MARDEKRDKDEYGQRKQARNNNNVRVAVHFNEIFMSQYDVK
jgi:hypothetical protein